MAGRCPYTSQSSHPVLSSSFSVLCSSPGALLGILSFNPGALLPPELLLAKTSRAEWSEHRNDLGGGEAKPSSSLCPCGRGIWQWDFMVHTQPQPRKESRILIFLLTSLNLVNWRLPNPSFIQLGCAFPGMKNTKLFPNFQKKLQRRAEINVQMPFCDLLWAFNVPLINLSVGKGDRNFPNVLSSPFF